MFARLLGLVKKEAVRLVPQGRCGELRYYDAGRYASAYYEVSGVPQYDFLVWFDDMKLWSDGSRISDGEKRFIRSAFQSWAQRKRKSIDLGDAS